MWYIFGSTIILILALVISIPIIIIGNSSFNQKEAWRQREWKEYLRLVKLEQEQQSN